MTSEGQVSYITPRLRKDEEAPLYGCLAHTIEPSQLAAVCTALSEGGKRGVHIIWAEFEEFMYVLLFSFCTRWRVKTKLHTQIKSGKGRDFGCR